MSSAARGGLHPVQQSRSAPVDHAQQPVRAVLERHVAARTVTGGAWWLEDAEGVHRGAVGSWDLAGRQPADVGAVLRIASLTKTVSAVLALRLVEAGALRLDDPVEHWLPETAGQPVLRHPHAEHVVPARRKATVHDLLTLRLGAGFDVTASGPTPYMTALLAPELGMGPPKPGAPLAPDAWAEAFARLPLLAQPGEQWLYDAAYAVLGVVLARAGRAPLAQVLTALVLEPLGMGSTSFSVDAADLDRLPPAHRPGDGDGDGVGGGLELDDPGGSTSAYATPPPFPSAAGGLVSTLADLRELLALLRDRGVHRGHRLLAEESVDLMLTDSLPDAVRAASPAATAFLGRSGWGLGGGVAPDGRFGWVGYGVSAWLDPRRGRLFLLATQRMPPSTTLTDEVDAAVAAADRSATG